MNEFNLNAEDFKEKTEAGVAELFLRKGNKQYRYVPEQDMIRFWDDTRWKPVSHMYVRNQILCFTKECHDVMMTEDPRWAAKLRTMGFTRAVLEFIKAKTATPLAEFDSYPHLLNVQNGILNLETLELMEHDRDMMLTNITRTRYLQDAKPPGIFFRALFYLVALPSNARPRRRSENAKRMKFFRRLCSIAFSGEMLENIFVVLSGMGATGKSTMMEFLSFVFGSYSTKLFVKSLSGRTPATNDLARLQGKRLVAVAETDENMSLNSATIKSLTGGDEQTARYLYKEFFQFKPEATFFLHTNTEPDIADRSHGMWRRVKLIKSNRMIPERKRNSGTLRLLQMHADTIFSYLVSDIVNYRDEGLKIPESVVSDTQAYQEDTDPLAEVFRYLEVDPNHARLGSESAYFVSIKYLVFLQNSLADGAGTQKMKGNGISRSLTARGFVAGRGRVGNRLERGFYGLRPVDLEGAAA